jgi:hypothetical protein
MSRFLGHVAAGIASGEARPTDASTISSIVSATWGPPLQRVLSLAGNYTFPNHIPSAPMWLQMYVHGAIDWARLRYGLRANGVALSTGPDEQGTEWEDMWRRYVAIQRPEFNETDLTTMLRLGQIDPARWLAGMQFRGWKELRDLELFRYTDDPLSMGDAIDLYLRGWITQDVFAKHVSASGKVSPGMVSGGLDQALNIPGIPTLVSWAGGPAADDRLAEAIRADEEQPPWLAYWLRCNGALAGGGYRTAAGVDRPEFDFAKSYWRSHWQPLPLAYLWDYTFRARGDPDDPSTWNRRDLPPLRNEMIESVLRWNGIAPGLRHSLSTLARPLIPVRQLRMIAASGILPDRDLVERYQDYGYTRTDAELLVEFGKKTEQTKKLKALKAESVGRIERAYIQGTITREQAAVALLYLYKDEPIPNTLVISSPSVADVEAALRDPVINAALIAIDEDEHSKVVNERVQATRQLYLSGQLNLESARVSLLTLGVALPRVEDYLAVWQAQLAAKSRAVSAGEVKRLILDGLISPGEGLRRLLNLNYRDQDARLIIALAEVDLEKAKARAAQAAARTKAQQVKAQQQLVKAQQRELRQMQRSLAGKLSPAKLCKMKWSGLIPESEVYRRLELLGWSRDDVGRLITDCEPKPKSAGAGKGKKTAPPPPANGSAGSGGPAPTG